MPPNPPKRIQRPQREGYAGAVRTARGSAAAFCPIAHRVKPLETLLPSVPPLPGGAMGLSTAFPRPQLSGCPLPIHRGFSSSAPSLWGSFPSLCSLLTFLFGSPLIPFGTS